jgi:hypothetical protein
MTATTGTGTNRTIAGLIAVPGSRFTTGAEG